ncbi:TonB-dependent receptor plug domain-containing protein [Pigmentiphaga litoralis]|uniref:TonB-dependent receptor plug domain-containing protein n=1 Tax=Pigmentiphaga litoralis TaxID=516702 RepID=UPI001E3A8096|nr:TonB-dependent receptor [Pigmentiphaga litoralis]
MPSVAFQFGPALLLASLAAGACYSLLPNTANASMAGIASSNDSLTLESITPYTDSAALIDLPLEQLLEVAVVRTATRLPQPISDAPSAVVVLTAKEIREFGWRTLADALATLPGLYVTSDRNYSYLGARGFSRPGDYDSRFLLMIDGYRTNDSVYDQAAIGTEALLDLDLVDRIEYVPGPGAAVYGSNAFFGVINVITRQGRDLAGPQAAVALGSHGERKARFSYGWNDGEGRDLLISVTDANRRGQDLYYPEFDTPAQNGGVARRLDYDRSRNLFLKASAGDLTVSAAHSDRTKGVPTGSFGAVFNTPNQTVDTQSYINASYQKRLSDGVALGGQAYWGRYDYQGVGLYPGEPPTTNVDGDRALWWGGDLHATFTQLARQKIVVGMDVRRDARRDQYNFNINPYELYMDDKRTGDRRGIYFEDEIRLPAGFLLNLGARYDNDNVTGGHFNPRVALNYTLTPRTTAKLIYGTAYRAPNAYELYYSVPGESGQLPNPNLRAERIATRELVLDHAYAKTGRVTLSVFQYAVRDLISLTTDPDSGSLIYRNRDRVKTVGAELSVVHNFARGARLRASYAWQRAQDATTGDRLDNSPSQLVKVNLTTPVLREDIRLGSEMQCTSARLTANAATGGACIANLTLSSARLVPRAMVSLSLYNAFDKKYADPAGPAFVQEALQRQSRTLRAKLAYEF